MPAALFIPEEHNCCYRYSYSGALQTPAASVSANNTAQYTHACAHTHTHTDSRMPHTLSRLLWATLAVHLHGLSSAFPSQEQSALARIPPTSSCLPTSPSHSEPTSGWSMSPPPPAPNHYAHNHLKAKEDGEHICMVCVTGARSLDCKRRLAPYSLDVYLSRSFNLSLTLNDACMNDEIIAVIVFVE